MTTTPITAFSPVTYKDDSPKEQIYPDTASLNNSHFDKLFAAVFDSMKLQELVGSADLSNMLNTIANISKNHGK